MKVENSWKIIVPTQLNNFKAFFFCKCGKKSVLNLKNGDYPQYSCRKCNNTSFLSYENYKEINRGVCLKKINISCHFIEDDKKCHFTTFVYLPKYDYTTASIVFEKEILAIILLTDDLKISFLYLEKELKYKNFTSKFESLILETMQNALLEYLSKQEKTFFLIDTITLLKNSSTTFTFNSLDKQQLKQAREIILKHNNYSISFLQRTMGISYKRAAILMKQIQKSV